MKELDVVKLKDGREGTIIMDYGEACMVEVIGNDGKTIEMSMVLKADIVKIIYSA